MAVNLQIRLSCIELSIKTEKFIVSSNFSDSGIAIVGQDWLRYKLSFQELNIYMSALFGTDGIRGIAGEFPLDTATVAVIGKALADYVLREKAGTARIVVGRDTRESGPQIEAAIVAGIRVAGGECESAGVITTPGVAYLAGAGNYDLGVVISASHNPFRDNGIKIFLPNGMKSDSNLENFVESAVISSKHNPELRLDLKSPRVNESLRLDYIRHLIDVFADTRFDGMRVVIDCANGAASEIAPEVFSSLGASVITINVKPDGRNINDNCGSLFPEGLGRKVLMERADVGIAFDGDADRTLLIDEQGEIMDGDRLLRILAADLLEQGKLVNRTVVATIMSNLGLERSLKNLGIRLLRTPVGDKYVLEELLRTNSELGGEQSGHIIFPAISLVGDGIVTAASVLKTASKRSEKFSSLAPDFKQFPQILINVPVREKLPFDSVPEIATAVAEVEAELAGSGRLLLRYSGTENLARVMIEAEDSALVESNARKIAETIAKTIGAPAN